MRKYKLILILLIFISSLSFSQKIGDKIGNKIPYNCSHLTSKEYFSKHRWAHATNIKCGELDIENDSMSRYLTFSDTSSVIYKFSLYKQSESIYYKDRLVFVAFRYRFSNIKIDEYSFSHKDFIENLVRLYGDRELKDSLTFKYKLWNINNIFTKVYYDNNEIISFTIEDPYKMKLVHEYEKQQVKKMNIESIKYQEKRKEKLNEYYEKR